MRERVETAAISNLGDGILGIAKQLASRLYPQMDEVLEDSLACFLLELPAKCRSIAPEQTGEVL